MVHYYRVPKKKRFLEGISLNLVLIFLNVILFIVFSALLGFGFLKIDNIALNPLNVVSGKYLWAILTSMFMHGGFFHLFVNMLSLLFVGSFVEKILGERRYLSFYLGAGIFAGLFFVLMSFLFFPSDLNAYAVGASGALFGLIGLLVLLTPNQPVYVMFIPIPIKMKYAGPGMLAVLWLISVSPMLVGGTALRIGNTAHLGGLIAGVCYGLYLHYKFPRKTSKLKEIFS